MKISLEFFGPIRDRVTQTPETLLLDPVPASLEALVEKLADELDSGDALRDPHLRIAINDQLCSRDQAIALQESDRIAVLSPFSGG